MPVCVFADHHDVHVCNPERNGDTGFPVPAQALHNTASSGAEQQGAVYHLERDTMPHRNSRRLSHILQNQFLLVLSFQFRRHRFAQVSNDTSTHPSNVSAIAHDKQITNKT